MSRYNTLYRCKNCHAFFLGDVTGEINDVCAENDVGEMSVCADMMLEINSRVSTVRPHVCRSKNGQVLSQVIRCGVGEFIGLSIIVSNNE